ncbi:MAG TPA: SDR family NAD(P)-dependent oxidoreductase, partial [Rhabdaerophilum sp.]|nr:SDR family NAD(P)-dependent oxidoreductase [Rhabdaerophilum sp.]
MRLKDKVAIVTGGAQGFGEGIAEVYAREGAKVVVTDLNEEGAQKVAARLGNGAIGVGGDVSKLADAKAIVTAAIKAFG